MGTVFSGFDREFDLPCAIKVVNLEMLERPDVLARFMSEARIMRRIRHGAVVQVYDLDRLPGDLPFIVQEWIEGGSLSGYVTSHGPLSPEMAINVMVIVCTGIEEAHAQGVIHRDIKADNILLTPEGYPKVTDFGIAMMETGRTRLTQDGAGMGTLGHMAPEQMQQAKDVDERADVHALGVTLWEILTGQKPPPGLFFSVSLDSDPFLLNGVPDELVVIIKRATEIRREARYQNVAELRLDLETARPSFNRTGRTQLTHGSALDSTVSQPALPVPSPSSLHPPTTTQTPPVVNPVAIVARRISRPSSAPPASSAGQDDDPIALADTHMGGDGHLADDVSAPLEEVQRARRRSQVRFVGIVAAALFIGGLAAWAFMGRPSPDSTIPAVSVLEPQLEPKASPATPVPHEPEATALPSTRASVEPAPVIPTELPTSPTTPVVEKAPMVEPVAPHAPDRTAKYLDVLADHHGKQGKPIKPIKPDKHHRGASVDAQATGQVKASEPDNAPVRVSVFFPEGDSITVWLVGPSGRRTLPTSVPPGIYKVVGDFPSGERTAISALTIEAGKPVKITCIPQVVKCHVR
ncbi:protein kinase [Candidatus Uhrbacteria bacterium]|nr:protein kinase [Candidatus Uhrbacteria bacterium]